MQKVYKVLGGRKLRIELSYPPEASPRRSRPAMVFFHGGGWKSGNLEQFKPQANYFSERGMVCARADYRSFSTDSVTAEKCVEDAADAIRWVRDNARQLGIDPNRIVASGASAGGHLAACTFFADDAETTGKTESVSQKPDALVLFNPVLSLVDLPEPIAREPITGLDKTLLKQLSPIFQITGNAPPTIILDGTEDYLNAVVREFVERSQALGAQTEARYAQGQPHGFFNVSPWLEETTREVDNFLCRIGFLQNEPRASLPARARYP